ncbi:MAG: hypothetical protein Q7T79_03125 [bacterium]|nr:hypothetical protein [bacterium]
MLKKIFKISFIILLLLIITVGFSPKKNQAADRSSDVIGLRVVPNLNNWSALRWYREQKFTGSPQTLLVDGYDAVRDGRTVYVNVANIAEVNGIDKLFTNINIISYNQEAEGATLDIFGQIIKHWKFNTNITDEKKKLEIIKDVTRLAYLADIKKALENYRSKNGFYPKLSAGSYLANKTISTWPSWQGTLGKELGMTLPIDPVNKLGGCVRFNEKTCWNDQNGKFATVFPELPLLSQVFYYSASSTGARYGLCAVMTSSYIGYPLDARACKGSNFENHSPVINFLGCNENTRINNFYSCQVKASDPDGGAITFDNLISQPVDFSLSSTGLISGTPTTEGPYTLEVTIKDNFGLPAEGTYNLNVYTYCGDGRKQSPNGDTPVVNEICDGTGVSNGTPTNATCASNCASWQCNNQTSRSGFHKDGNTCAPNTRSCFVANASSTQQFWDRTLNSGSGDWKTECQVVSCSDENLNTGYHEGSNNDCISNTEYGQNRIPNVSSYVRYWDKALGDWGGLIIVSCNTGYVLNSNACIPPPIVNRIVLTWTSTQDLDPYLIVSTTGTTTVYYNNKKPNGAGAELNCGNSSNCSQTNSVVPEIITISALVRGANYIYRVNNCNSLIMNATVKVLNANGDITNEYFSGTLTDDWNVFRMNDRGAITNF